MKKEVNTKITQEREEREHEGIEEAKSYYRIRK